MEVSSEKSIRIPIALCEIFLVFFFGKKMAKAGNGGWTTK